MSGKTFLASVRIADDTATDTSSVRVLGQQRTRTSLRGTVFAIRDFTGLRV